MIKRPLIATITLVLCGACYETELASPSLDAVATVTVTPADTTIATNDTVRFRAELRDGSGAAVTGRPVTWSVTDTAVIQVQGTFGAELLVRGKAMGSALLRATSDARTGEAGVTVQ